MVETCSGDSFAFNRLLGSGRMARSGNTGDAVSGERALEKEGERVKPDPAYSVLSVSLRFRLV